MNQEVFIGKIIGNYKIVKRIGEGTYSSVFLAQEISSQPDQSKDNNQKVTPHYVACKIISNKQIKHKTVAKRLASEIKNHQLMKHPNVVQLIDVLKDNSYFYIILEFCLYGELYKTVYEKGKLDEKEASFYFKQILLGIQYIHSLNITHRDLKPENILIDQYGKIKITDFGLSKLLDSESNGMTKTPCGSPCYVSPECISCLPYDAKKSDIWSCGVILYSITTGHLPWTKKSQSELFEQIKVGKYTVPTNVSESCSDLIKKLMEIDVSKRISIEEALNHPFLKENDYNEIKLGSKKSNDLQLSGYEKVLNCLSEIQANKDSAFIKIRKEFQNESDKVIPTV